MKSSCEELIRKTRPIIGQIAILIITAGLYFPDGTLPGVNEGQVDERTEPHLECLDVNLTLLSPHSSVLHLDLLLPEPSPVENSSSRHQLLIELRIW